MNVVINPIRIISVAVKFASLSIVLMLTAIIGIKTEANTTYIKTSMRSFMCNFLPIALLSPINDITQSVYKF